MKLNSSELMLLKDLQNNPSWGSILTKMRDHAAVPAYKPGAGEDQKERWVYKSGFAGGVLFMLTQLGYRNDDRES